MKKILQFTLCLVCLFGLVACSKKDEPKTPNTDNTSKNENDDNSNQNASVDKKVLIVYFTYPETDGTDASAGASRIISEGEVIGNTEFVANVIQERTNGELHKIETVQNYPESHDPLVDQAADEKADSARPELASKINDLDQYNTVFIGYPNWWADMPMPLYTFLEEYDFSGKIIVPFSTHGGNGFSGTINTISDLQPDATLNTDGLTISRNNVVDSQSEIEEWLSNLGY